jgi:hypothetical protein
VASEHGFKRPHRERQRAGSSFANDNIEGTRLADARGADALVSRNTDELTHTSRLGGYRPRPVKSLYFVARQLFESCPLLEMHLMPRLVSVGVWLLPPPAVLSR